MCGHATHPCTRGRTEDDDDENADNDDNDDDDDRGGLLPVHLLPVIVAALL